MGTGTGSNGADAVADDIDSDAGPLFFEGKTFDTVGVENNVL